MQLNSDQINEIASALSKAQSIMKPAIKDKKNPHFRNLYASLNSVIEASKEALSVNGLSVSQQITEIGDKTFLVSTLMHTSGQYLRSYLAIKSDVSTPQKLGACLTYYRRYSLSSLIGIDAEEDDDGNEASKPTSKSVEQPKPPLKITPEQAEQITCLIEGNEDLKKKVLTTMKSKFGSDQMNDIPAAAFEPFTGWIRSLIEKEVSNAN